MRRRIHRDGTVEGVDGQDGWIVRSIPSHLLTIDCPLVGGQGVCLPSEEPSSEDPIVMYISKLVGNEPRRKCEKIFDFSLRVKEVTTEDGREFVDLFDRIWEVVDAQMPVKSGDDFMGDIYWSTGGAQLDATAKNGRAIELQSFVLTARKIIEPAFVGS